MKKLKIILLFSLILLIPFSIYFNKSKYSDEINIEGIVNNYEIDNNKITIELIGKEKVLCTYYLKDNEDINISLGDKLKLIGKLQVPKDNTNFNLFNYRKYLLSKKIYYQFIIEKYEITKNDIVKYKIKNWIKNRINDSKNKDYLNLFILGENNLDDKIKQSYQKNGISHLFAISGMHITLFTSFILYVINKMNKNKIINFVILVLFLLFYMFLTNYSPSVIRASLFFIALNIKKIFNIDVTNFELIILILLILLAYNPYYIYNVGFLYSFVVCISLILFGTKEKNYLKKLFNTSLISFLVGMPITINNYFNINLLTPILNIIFVPFISFIIFPLSLINFIAPVIDPLNNFLLDILEIISFYLAKVNFMNITLCKMPPLFVIVYYIVIIWVINKINYKKVVVIFIMLLIHMNRPNLKMYPIITAIDVGQGDSILVELPQNKWNILIDTGGILSYNNQYNLSENITLPYLKSRGIKKIDYLILTHGDYDHMGEAINLVENFKVEKVIFNCGEFNDLEKDLIKVLNKKKIPYYSCIKELNIDKNKLYFLQTREYDNENDSGNVIYTELNGYKFMFMGDAGVEKEKDILEKYNISNVDVLKVGHHGSKTSSSIEFINEISPKYSIISVGKNNRYGHPNKEVLNNLDNSKIYRTDQDGSIMFKITNNKLRIETCSP